MAFVRPTGIYNTVSRWGGMAQRAWLPDARLGSSKALTLNLKPLLPLIVAGSALLYNQGQEANKPDGGERNASLRILAESTLAYLILENTTGVYPLLGLGLAAYRAGQQTTALEQLKAVINTATTLFLGSLGVTFFKGMSKMANQMDDEAIFKALGETHIQDWLAHLDQAARDPYWNAEAQQAFRGLHDQLQPLRGQLGQMYPDWLPAAVRGPQLPPDSEAYRQLSHDILQTKTAAVKHFDTLGQWAAHGLPADTQRAVKKFMYKVEYSQSSWIRFIRGINPILGYTIMGMMIGASFLAPRVNAWVGHRRSDLQQREFHKSLFPADNRVLTPAGGSHGGAHGGRASHGSGYGTPYMVWPGMNNDQATYSGDLYDPNARPRGDDSQDDESTPAYTLRSPGHSPTSSAGTGYVPPAPAVAQQPLLQYPASSYQPGMYQRTGYPPQTQNPQAWYPQARNMQQAH